eukprot:TRINITY_DN11925_c0_g1_i3.p1 TRINITY_DN11925_c0_g1~~TRINITY_DN11925_c0_g1_i3.p1  ORF type:complete len:357 (-),score=134.58 TRINITY_DN11925_c0_g1_i3:105-1175(-)
MSIVRKNLRATKGTKDWRRNIDVTEFQENLYKLNREKEIQENVKAKLDKGSLLFYEDRGDTGSKRGPLDPNRFKRKEKDPKLASVNEQKKVAEIIRNGAHQPADVKPGEENLDIWGDVPTTSKARRTKMEVEIPAVVEPHPGQSYNPSYEDHQKLVDKVIDDEVQKVTKPNIPSKKSERIRKVLSRRHEERPRTEKEAIHLAKLKEKKRKAKEDSDFKNIEVISRTIDKQKRKLNNRLEQFRKKKEIFKSMIRKGIVPLGKKLGRRRYKMRDEDAIDKDEYSERLRNFKPITTSLIKDRMDSVFRRQIMELPNGVRTKKKRLTKIKTKVKYDTEMFGPSDDEDQKPSKKSTLKEFK